MFGIVPKGNVKSKGVDCILMALKLMDEVSGFCVPNLASSIIATSDKSAYPGEYLSPFLLKEQLVKGKTCAFSVLKEVKF
jgi:hypothetical protein